MSGLLSVLLFTLVVSVTCVNAAQWLLMLNVSLLLLLLLRQPSASRDATRFTAAATSPASARKSFFPVFLFVNVLGVQYIYHSARSTGTLSNEVILREKWRAFISKRIRLMMLYRCFIVCWAVSHGKRAETDKALFN